MSNNLWQTDVLSLRIIRTDKGYMFEHNGKYVCDSKGDNCWDTLDDAMNQFSKLVLSNAFIPPLKVYIEPDCGTSTDDFEPDCGTPMLLQSMEELSKLAKDAGR